MSTLDEELHQLEHRLKQLKLDYEQYFLGSRPREPRPLRDEIQRQVQQILATPIRNTALRFRFNSTNARFQAFKRQWDNILRQIECGTYERHVFKANLRDCAVAPTPPFRAAQPTRDIGALFDDYRCAAAVCGQDVSRITPDALRRAVEKQGTAARQQLGCSQVAFRIAVEAGRVKIKVSRAQA